MHHLVDAARGGGLQQQPRAVDVDRAQKLGVLGERDLGNVVVNDVATFDGSCHGVGVADVALHELDLDGAIVGIR